MRIILVLLAAPCNLIELDCFLRDIGFASSLRKRRKGTFPETTSSATTCPAGVSLGYPLKMGFLISVMNGYPDGLNGKR